MSLSKLSFSVESLYDTPEPLAVTPTVDGVPLSDLAEEFEKAQGFEPPGGYGGLVPDHFNYGPLDSYFLHLVTDDNYFAGRRRIYLLGCECGEVGCWPLEASVETLGCTIVWKNFRQPHRPDRNYSGFGAFEFDSGQYESAIDELVATLSA